MQERSLENSIDPCKAQVSICYPTFLTRSFSGSRKAARILLTLDENDPRRLFEGEFLIDIAEEVCVCLSLPIFNMIITLIIPF